MNSRILLLSILSVLMLASCTKDVDYNYKAEYERSYKAWLDFRATAGNTYRYTTSSSSWVGISSKTTITVNNGQVIGREYTLTQSQTGSAVIVEQWFEDRNSLNSHDRGFPILTLDQVYEKAKNQWLVKRDDATTYFEAKNNGMLSLAGYVPNGCADDCFTGVTVISIERI